MYLALGTKMINIFCDAETTGLNCYCDEIIEMYFHINNDINYHYKARPLEWSYEAEQIHGITYGEANLYPDKSIAIKNLINWFSNIGSFRLITYANKNTELGIINFDVACLWNEINLLGYPQYFLENKLGMKEPLSVHDTAKYCAKNGYFTPIRGKSGRQSFSQENVYLSLFDEKYNAHNCVDDTKALVKIYNKLLKLNNESNSDLFWHQTSYS